MADEPLLFFHDTSVLVNFHRPGLLPVLQALLQDKVRWTASIRVECERQEAVLGLTGLVLAAEDLLGEPLYPEPSEHAAIRQLRSQMAVPGDHSQQHLGEAETITLIQKRRLRAVFVTDDGDAIRWAQPIDCVGTWKLIRFASTRGLATPDEAKRLWQAFVDAGGIPPRHLRTADAFAQYLQS